MAKRFFEWLHEATSYDIRRQIEYLHGQRQDITSQSSQSLLVLADYLEEYGNEEENQWAEAIRTVLRNPSDQTVHFGEYSPFHVLSTTVKVRDDLPLTQLDKLTPDASDDYPWQPLVLFYPQNAWYAYGRYEQQWYASNQSWGHAGNNPNPRTYNFSTFASPTYHGWPHPEGSSLYNVYTIAIPLTSIKKVPTEVLLSDLCHYHVSPYDISFD